MLKMAPVEGRNVGSMFLTSCLAVIFGLKLLVFSQLYSVAMNFNCKLKACPLDMLLQICTSCALKSNTGCEMTLCFEQYSTSERASFHHNEHSFFDCVCVISRKVHLTAFAQISVNWYFSSSELS